MVATTATVNERTRAKRGEISPDETGFLRALAGVMASSGASSTSLTIKAKPTASQLATKTTIRGPSREPSPAAGATRACTCPDSPPLCGPGGAASWPPKAYYRINGADPDPGVDERVVRQP